MTPPLGAAVTRDMVRAADYGIDIFAVEYWPPLPRSWRPTNPPKRKRGAAPVETLPVSTKPMDLSPGNVIVQNPTAPGAPGRWRVTDQPTYNHLTGRMRILVADEANGDSGSVFEVPAARKVLIAPPEGPSQTASRMLGERL